MKRLPAILLCLASWSALAESGAYRVEVIVFRNLAESATPVAVDELRSFSRFPALEETELPDALQVVKARGKLMENAWNRLRSSKAYKPLLYAAWEQERISYYPPIHIHDEQVFATRLSTAPTEPGAQPSLEPGVAQDRSRDDQPARKPAVDGLPMMALTGQEPPDPVYDILYRLDGAVQLRRSRFLHLDLDLEYRTEPVKTPVPYQELTPAPLVYGFHQSRQISSSKMQYFDSPFLGALVLVSPVPALGAGLD